MLNEGKNPAETLNSNSLFARRNSTYERLYETISLWLSYALPAEEKDIYEKLSKILLSEEFRKDRNDVTINHNEIKGKFYYFSKLVERCCETSRVLHDTKDDLDLEKYATARTMLTSLIAFEDTAKLRKWAHYVTVSMLSSGIDLGDDFSIQKLIDLNYPELQQAIKKWQDKLNQMDGSQFKEQSEVELAAVRPNRR